MATAASPTQEQLLKRIERIGDKEPELESELIVLKNVNELLSQEADNLNQYQGRSCIIVDSITSIEHKTTEEITKNSKNVMIKNLF